MKSLLIITTLNQLKYNQIVEQSIPNIIDLDTVFIDDGSKDGTVAYLKSKSRNVITKEKGVGLTDSWNIGYRIFKEKKYDNLFISNNDVILNKISIINMINALSSYTLVCPLSSQHGAGHNHKYQSINKYYPSLSKYANNRQLYGKIIDKLINNSNKKDYNCQKMPLFNGFFFGVNTNIIKSEYDSDHLFNPKFPQSGQEGDLQKRLIDDPVVCKDTFIFHFKGITAPNLGTINGQDKRNLPETIEGYHA